MSTSQATSSLDIRNVFRSKDAVMALVLVTIIGMMLVPLPPIIIDFLVVLNLAMAIGVILLTIYISKPMDFSAFPSMLLLITLFTLGLNIAASRQILLHGNAGKVIDTFGDMVIGGNYIVGVVIFMILMVVQFVVITKGAGRVAEVSARFTLDAMPGKQLSIDADLNAGLIDEDEARQRRKDIEIESGFYGAMDGASKFVSGSATAAMIVIAVNIFGGIVIGTMQRDLEIMDALQAYTLVTVGAGLAMQIPALIVSAAAGLIVTRSSDDSSLGLDLIGQLSNFNVLVIGAVIMVVIGLVPGLPKVPFLSVAGLLGTAAFTIWRSQQVDEEVDQQPISTEPESPQDMLEMVVIDPIELEVGYGLIPLIDNDQADNLLRRITAIRRQVMAEMGLVLPIVRVRDNLRIQPQTYRIKIRGEEVATGELLLDRFLAIPENEVEEQLPGIPTKEPAFGLPAIWISDAEKGRAELLGYTVVNPLSVLGTHLLEIVRSDAPDLLSRQIVQEMLDQLRMKVPASVEGLVPEQLSLAEVQSVLRNLLRERVPIRDLTGILEVLAQHAPMTRDPNILAEAVRHTLARTLSNQYRDAEGVLHVFTLSPPLEVILRESLGTVEGGLAFQLDAASAQSILNRIGGQMERLAQLGHFPILLSPRELRLALRKLTEKALPNLVVLAFSEVSPGTKVSSHGMVEQP